MLLHVVAGQPVHRLLNPLLIARRLSALHSTADWPTPFGGVDGNIHEASLK